MARPDSLRLGALRTPISLKESQDSVYATSHEVHLPTTVSSIGSTSIRRNSNDADDASRSDTCPGLGVEVSDYEPQHSGATASPSQLKEGRSHDLGKISTSKILIHRPKACCPSWGVWKEYWHYSWLAEALSCCGAVVCLGAIVITLSMHQGKTLPQWPLNISINALLAVFTAILKATLALPLTEGISQLKWQWFSQHPQTLIDLDRFDSASRGAWGSSWFLFNSNTENFVTTWRRPWEYPILLLRRSGGSTIYMAQFAAFLTMLGLAVDPFSQQVLRYVDCPQNVSSLTAVISRTNIYARAAEGIGESQAIIDDPMVVAINTGLVNPSQSMTPLVAVQCGSGNCTFPQFSTVGICHSCEDVSNQVIINYSNKGGISNATLPGSLLDDTPALWLGTDVLLNTSTKGWNQSSIMQLRVLSLPNPYEGLSGPKASAFRCTLSPCIKTYNALMTNSILNETLMSIETIGFNQLFGEGLVQDNAIAYRLAINRTLVNGQWENCHASTIPGPGLINVAAANIDASPTRPASQDQTFNESYYLQGCVWQFGYQTTLAIQQELTSVLNLQQMVLSEGVPDGGVIADTIWRNGLANLTSMNSLMQNLSDAMTASVRQRGDDGPSAWAQGQAMINSTCVDVRWVWLSYSAVLVGLVIVFQVLLVIQMPGDVVDKAWKSSSLPLLFFSVDDTLKQKVQYNQTKDDMVKLAEITSAQLVEGHKGAVFI